MTAANRAHHQLECAARQAIALPFEDRSLSLSFFLGIGFPDAVMRRIGIGLQYHSQKTYPAEWNVLACCGAFWR